MSENQTVSKKRWEKFLIICVFAVMSCVVLSRIVPYVIMYWLSTKAQIESYRYNNDMKEFVALDGEYNNYEITVEEPALYTKFLQAAVYKIEGLDDKEWLCVYTVSFVFGDKGKYTLYRHKDISEEPILDWEISNIVWQWEDSICIDSNGISGLQEALRGSPSDKGDAEKLTMLIFDFKDKGVRFTCPLYSTNVQNEHLLPEDKYFLYVNEQYYDVTEHFKAAIEDYMIATNKKDYDLPKSIS